MSTGPPIEWATPALRFDQRKTVLVPLPRFPKSISQRLCFGIREEQSVRDIVSSFHGEILLAERINPANSVQNRPNQIVFGLALACRLAQRQFFEDRAEIGVQPINSRIIERYSFGRSANSFREEIA